VANNCNYNAPQLSSTMTRDGCTTVALVARYEGYSVGAADAWGITLLERARGRAILPNRRLSEP